MPNFFSFSHHYQIFWHRINILTAAHSEIQNKLIKNKTRKLSNRIGSMGRDRQDETARGHGGVGRQGSGDAERAHVSGGQRGRGDTGKRDNGTGGEEERRRQNAGTTREGTMGGRGCCG